MIQGQASVTYLTVTVAGHGLWSCPYWNHSQVLIIELIGIYEDAGITDWYHVSYENPIKCGPIYPNNSRPLWETWCWLNILGVVLKHSIGPWNGKVTKYIEDIGLFL